MIFFQASGEAEYTTDIPTFPNELAAAFVLTTKVISNIRECINTPYVLTVHESYYRQMSKF